VDNYTQPPGVDKKTDGSFVADPVIYPYKDVWDYYKVELCKRCQTKEVTNEK
jgi:hypothetical protein